MNKNNQSMRPKNILGRLTQGVLLACMVLGFGFAELQAQTGEGASFYNSVGGEVTNEVTLEPGDFFTLVVGVNNEVLVDGVTATMLWDNSMLTEQSAAGAVTDLVGSILPFPLYNVVSQDNGKLSFSKAILGTGVAPGSFEYFSLEFQVSPDASNGTTEIYHLLGPNDQSNIVHFGNELMEASPSLVITIQGPVDCPSLGLNIGDACDDGDDMTENDMVTEDCECMGTVVYDCPDLEANIGDACDDGDDMTENDMVTENCECMGTMIYDCPALEANIGDACDDGDDMTENDMVTEDCECMGTVVYDCPDLEANIGDACDDGDDMTENDMVNDNCVCMGTPIVDPCLADAGSVEFEDGSAAYTVCVDDDEPSMVSVEVVESASDDYMTSWVITDPDGNLLGIPGTEDAVEAIDFDDAGPGNCLIWVLSFDPEDSNVLELAEAFENGEAVNASELDGCYDLSESIVVVRINCAPVWDCPDLQANIGDACDDGDDNTENDVVTENCECMGTMIYDCPDLQANIGDACDDGDDMTENDMVTENCECMGSLIVWDCPELEANIGDPCNDGDANTINDMVDADCNCVGTPFEPSDCDDWVMYLNNNAGGVTDIFSVDISGGDAELTYVTTVDYQAHIAYNPADNLIYVMHNGNGSYVTVNPHTAVPEVSAPVFLSMDIPAITTAAFAPNGKLLVGSMTENVIYSVNVADQMVSVFDAYSPINGGDIAFDESGMLYLATRSGNGYYQVFPDDVLADQLIGNIPSLVTGMALTETDQMIMSHKNNPNLLLRNLDGSDAGMSYALMLEGEAYNHADGDMTSGCNTYSDENEGECDAFNTYYVDHVVGGMGSLYRVNFSGSDANLTLLTTVDYPAHIGYNAMDGLIYLVNPNGAFLRVYDPATDSFLGDLPLIGSPAGVVAVVYNPEDGMLYVGSSDANEIYTVDLGTGVVTYFADAPVNGGDLAIQDGKLYLATRTYSKLHEITLGGPVQVGNIPGQVNGMAQANNATDVIIANNYANVFTQLNVADASVVTTYNVMVDGNPFTTSNGDMAAGCADDTDEGTPETPVVVDSGMMSTITSYPNPTNGPSQVVFVTGETGRTLLEVFDMNGRNVSTLYNQEAQAGKEYRVDFNGSSLPNGVYIYKMTTNNETIIEKFMIAR